MSNSCYMNAVFQVMVEMSSTIVFLDLFSLSTAWSTYDLVRDCVQVIAHTPPLAYMILRSELEDVEGNESGFNQTVKKIIAFLLKPTTDETCLSLESVKAVFGEKFNGLAQECADEFLMYIFEMMEHKDGSKWKHSPLGIIKCSLRLQHKCQCGEPRSSHLDDYTVLSLAGNLKDRDSNNLEQMIKDYFEPQTLGTDSLLACTKCHQKGLCISQTQLAEIGTVLIITIRCYDENGKKILLSPIAVEEELSIQQSHGTTDLILTGIVYHQGRSVKSGHYFSIFRGPGNQWFQANDTKVIPVDCPRPAKSSNSTPFILTYTRKDQVPESLHTALGRLASTVDISNLQIIR